MIDPSKGWYSAQDLAGLPGMPETYSAVIRAAKKNLWTNRPKVRNKGLEYALSSLPDETRKHILGLAISQAVETPSLPVLKGDDLPAVQAPGPLVVKRGQKRKAADLVQLTDWHRSYQEGAVILCRAVEVAQAAADCSVRQACRELAERLVDGSAHPELIAAAKATYLKPRKGVPLGGVNAQQSRLQRMMAFYEQGRLAGDVGKYLAPGRVEKTGPDPVHVAAFLYHFCRPNRPPVSEAWRAAEQWYADRGLTRPAVDTWYRIENDLPVTIKYRGRVTGSAWRSLRPYIERDVSMFHSNDIWVGDGHSFKAKVQHPIHGQPFTPEVTVIIDWVSRKIVGWSIALAESTVAVSDAFRHAQSVTRARPLVYYSDNGSGQTGKMIDCPVSGTLARQGIAHETGIPGNPQARGIIERLWQVTLIPLARTYPTCTWRGADENATNKMLKLLNRKDQGGIRIPSFRQLVDDVARAVADYNLHHVHRELEGRTPEDEYQARMDKGSIVFGPSDAELATLWMPEVVRTPDRGRVSLFGNSYCKADLVDTLPEGEKVRVRYDLHNAETVWLLNMEGALLGEARWDSHKEEAFPVPRMDQLRAARAAGKIQRGQAVIAEAQAELGSVIDLTPLEQVPPVVDVYAQMERVGISIPEAPSAGAPPEDFAQTYFAEPSDERSPQQTEAETLSPWPEMLEVTQETTPEEKPRRYQDPRDVALYFFGAQLDEADAEAEKKNAAG